MCIIVARDQAPRCRADSVTEADVRFGSLADIEARLSNVRFTPKADIPEHE